MRTGLKWLVVFLASVWTNFAAVADPIDIGSRRELFVDQALSGGELTTKPLKFTGRRLSLNYATSAAGNMRVELQDSAGQPISGFSLADADELFGDTIDQKAAWKNSTDVSRLAGQEVRLHFVLRDGDLFSFQFTD